MLGLLAALLAYACLRAWDVLFVPEPDPALAAPGPRVAYTWRLASAAYVAVAAAAVASRVPTSAALRAAEWLLPIAALAIAVQAAAFP